MENRVQYKYHVYSWDVQYLYHDMVGLFLIADNTDYCPNMFNKWQSGTYTERDLKVFPSPDIHSGVILAHGNEVLAVHGKQTPSHGGCSATSVFYWVWGGSSTSLKSK